jgi:hypothetical protein
MPNIPPLAQEVVKSPYFFGAVMLVVWSALHFLLPDDYRRYINAALAGWFVGTKIYELGHWYKNLWNKP